VRKHQTRNLEIPGSPSKSAVADLDHCRSTSGKPEVGGDRPGNDGVT
jgi:hypothetical protein